uniref:Tyrosine-protein phosphatase CDC14 n=1 Tax=Blastobotrys adeninivorans TaxID=409370 RepID=A0A060THY7_BLAAD
MLSRRKVPIIEFLKDRIYLGAFNYPPQDTETTVHFTIDDALPYNSFHHDFGPLNIGHLYRFAVTLHEVLADEDNQNKAVVLYSHTDPRSRANAACILCCYMILVQSWPPHLVLAPIAQADPPFMPFRDAGYAPADFGLSIQDIVYGLWRAKEHQLIDLKSFNLEEYELYERVDQGDFNEIPPHFVAFASPQQRDYNAPLNYPFQQVLDYFEANDVNLVVRLNSELYNKQEFENRGIRHMDLIFEDGTCPSMLFVQAFIGAVECVVARKGKVAVHCKAGLGRTGCLIGAYLIYTYGFTAQEAIGYMRFLRPGMVVGPQQHWLYLHQNEFREWRYTMTLSKVPDESLGGFYPLVSIDSPQAKGNTSYKSTSSSSSKASPPRTPERSIVGHPEVDPQSTLPVPTPGQPRKNSPSPAHSRRVPSKKHYGGLASPVKGATNSDDENDDDDDDYDDDHTNANANDPIHDRDDLATSPTNKSMTRRNISERLTDKQQMLMARQLRSSSNPSPQRVKRTASYQVTTTTTTTTTTTLSSSPPVDTLRRSSRISSNKGVRKPSGTTNRKRIEWKAGV